VIRLCLAVLMGMLFVGAATAQLEPAGYGFNVTMEHIPLWLTFEYAAAINVTSYTFTPYADFTYTDETHNNSWMILGSNDGHTVTVLDTRMNISMSSGPTLTFTLPKTGLYKFYYVYLFTGFGTAGQKMEIHLFAGVTEVAPVYVYLAGAPEPFEPGHLVLGMAGLIMAIGWRKAAGGRI